MIEIKIHHWLSLSLKNYFLGFWWFLFSSLLMNLCITEELRGGNVCFYRLPAASVSTQKIGKLWWKQRREWAQKQTLKRRRKTYVLISGAELRHSASWINITYMCINHFGVEIQTTFFAKIFKHLVTQMIENCINDFWRKNSNTYLCIDRFWR